MKNFLFLLLCIVFLAAVAVCRGLRRLRFLLHSDDGVDERAGHNHDDADPPEERLRLVVVDNGYQSLRDRLGVGTDVVRHRRRHVDLLGADPRHHAAEAAGQHEACPEVGVDDLGRVDRRRHLAGRDDNRNERDRRDNVGA